MRISCVAKAILLIRLHKLLALRGAFVVQWPEAQVHGGHGYRSGQRGDKARHVPGITQANARGIARIYGAVARDGALEGGRILSPAAIAAMTVEEVGGQDDLVPARPLRRGRGVMLNTLGQYGPNPDSFGHAGAGGSVGFGDPGRKLGLGYPMNQTMSVARTSSRISGSTGLVRCALKTPTRREYGRPHEGAGGADAGCRG